MARLVIELLQDRFVVYAVEGTGAANSEQSCPVVVPGPLRPTVYCSCPGTLARPCLHLPTSLPPS